MNKMNKMNKRLREAIEYCTISHKKNVVFAIPYSINAKDALALKEHQICAGMVLHHPPSEITQTSSSQWLGYFPKPGEWQLPLAKGTLVFIGSHLMITRQMAMSALHTNRINIVCKINGSYQNLNIYRFLFWRIGTKIHRRIIDMPHDSLLRQFLFRLTGFSPLNRVWRAVFKREGAFSEVRPRGRLDAQEHVYDALFHKAQRLTHPDRISPIPGRVLLVNAGLAAGGAERQIVNTLVGLQSSGKCESVALLAEYIDHAPQLDFFLHELQSKNIEVAQVGHHFSLASDGLNSLSPEIVELAADLPMSILEEILNLVEEFRIRRPSIVHAWQDGSSIKAGIAAVIAGVPNIVLASRNVTPKHFAYYQDYMSPVYRALAKLNSVKFLNNSQAGANDYTQWLGLPRERFSVVRNGVDFTDLKPSQTEQIKQYKESLGIPESALVVGSIFRFWAEKRPMLWLETAHILANQFPDLYFVIIGEGPMRSEMNSFIEKHGLKTKVLMPGARPDVSLPLSAMDIFVLASQHEGTPNVVLEAQWFGLPVVVTDAGGTKEAFMPNVTGKLANDATADEIAYLVAQYLNDQQSVNVANVKGPELVAREFGVNRMVEETLKLYEINGAS